MLIAAAALRWRARTRPRTCAGVPARGSRRSSTDSRVSVRTVPVVELASDPRGAVSTFWGRRGCSLPRSGRRTFMENEFTSIATWLQATGPYGLVAVLGWAVWHINEKKDAALRELCDKVGDESRADRGGHQGGS